MRLVRVMSLRVIIRVMQKRISWTRIRVTASKPQRNDRLPLIPASWPDKIILQRREVAGLQDVVPNFCRIRCCAVTHSPGKCNGRCHQ